MNVHKPNKPITNPLPPRCPLVSCHRWGPIEEETSTRRRQRLYLSEQTDGSEPNKLVVVTADIALPRVSTAEAISTWSEQAASPYVSIPCKTLVHPGEVNKMLDLPGHPNILVTHSDTPDVYVWNLDTQPDRATGMPRGTENPASREPSVADVVLTGHEENAEFALGTCSSEPFIASGGRDKNVLLWNLGDSGVLSSNAVQGNTLPARTKFQGHLDTVNDVAFVPNSSQELASVSDDSSLLFWDSRAGSAPVARVACAHGKTDVHCCDWSPLRSHLVTTGAADGSVRVWDRRKLQPPVVVLNHHNGAVTNVEWSPHVASVFASGDDDGLLCVWDVDTKGGEAEGQNKAKLKVAAPSQLMFQHAGHQLAVCQHKTDCLLGQI